MPGFPWFCFDSVDINNKLIFLCYNIVTEMVDNISH